MLECQNAGGEVSECPNDWMMCTRTLELWGGELECQNHGDWWVLGC